MTHDDAFTLSDLRVTIEAINGRCTCDHVVGDHFEMHGGQLVMPQGRFCAYAVQAALPVLPAKQRPLHPNDWMNTDTRITCPDPNCGLIMRIARTQSRVLRNSDTSGEAPTPAP
jgi:uncharacterized repeat protein (TIGR04076 family)